MVRRRPTHVYLQGVSIVGQRVVPWFVGWCLYLAKTGFKGQQTDQPLSPDRPDYVFAPLDDDRDHGSHGEFDDQAKSSSRQRWLSLHRGVVASGAGAAVGVAALALRRGTRG